MGDVERPAERPSVRLDSRSVLRCVARRRRGRGLECDTPLARPAGPRLVIRCRNCGTDHTFVSIGGMIVPLESGWRLPEEERVH